jgi:hypothetical protein
MLGTSRIRIRLRVRVRARIRVRVHYKVRVKVGVRPRSGIRAVVRVRVRVWGRGRGRVRVRVRIRVSIRLTILPRIDTSYFLIWHLPLSLLSYFLSFFSLFFTIVVCLPLVFCGLLFIIYRNCKKCCSDGRLINIFESHKTKDTFLTQLNILTVKQSKLTYSRF